MKCTHVGCSSALATRKQVDIVSGPNSAQLVVAACQAANPSSQCCRGTFICNCSGFLPTHLAVAAHHVAHSEHLGGSRQAQQHQRRPRHRPQLPRVLDHLSGCDGQSGAAAGLGGGKQGASKNIGTWALTLPACMAAAVQQTSTQQPAQPGLAKMHLAENPVGAAGREEGVGEGAQVGGAGFQRLLVLGSLKLQCVGRRRSWGRLSLGLSSLQAPGPAHGQPATCSWSCLPAALTYS